MAKKTAKPTAKKEECKSCNLAKTQMVIPKVITMHGALAKRLWPNRFKG